MFAYESSKNCCVGNLTENVTEVQLHKIMLLHTFKHPTCQLSAEGFATDDLAKLYEIAPLH